MRLSLSTPWNVASKAALAAASFTPWTLIWASSACFIQKGLPSLEAIKICSDQHQSQINTAAELNP
ncbi:hypothetical protein DY000_02007190 [Brassica cretica]|uniref:Uncharacterized protein n=1 Tax=Brassica cretica TaxID=69181 RepID=A0ABQ7CCG1_BRACR|nr:hypothetical protein DY000_02007190 [Brassica cretica]